jgi:hypothetical protein
VPLYCATGPTFLNMDLLALVKNAQNPGPAVAEPFEGVTEAQLTLNEAGGVLTQPAREALAKRPHLRYLQRLQRLEWLARLIADEEQPIVFRMKAHEMLAKSMGDYRTEVTVQQASSVLIVHDNQRGEYGEPDR